MSTINDSPTSQSKKRSRESDQPNDDSLVLNEGIKYFDLPKQVTVEEIITPTKKSKKSKKIKHNRGYSSEDDNNRICTVKEIVTTEKIYVENLSNTLNVCSSLI